MHAFIWIINQGQWLCKLLALYLDFQALMQTTNSCLVLCMYIVRWSSSREVKSASNIRVQRSREITASWLKSELQNFQMQAALASVFRHANWILLDGSPTTSYTPPLIWRQPKYCWTRNPSHRTTTPLHLTKISTMHYVIISSSTAWKYSSPTHSL